MYALIFFNSKQSLLRNAHNQCELQYTLALQEIDISCTQLDSVVLESS